MAGAGGLLDVPLHHDEEERLVLCKKNTQDSFVLSRSTGSHSATEDKRARTPMVRFLWLDDPSGWMPDGVISSCG